MSGIGKMMANFTFSNGTRSKKWDPTNSTLAKKRPAAVLSSVNAVNAEKEQLRICYADRNTHTQTENGQQRTITK